MTKLASAGSGERPSIHASAVKVGELAVLIRGPSGSGKSRLAFDLILAGRAGVISPTLFIGDDRVLLELSAGAVAVRGVAPLAGLIEIRGLGIRRMDFAPHACLAFVVDLDASDGARMPDADAMVTEICGIAVARIPVAAGQAALPLVIAALTTAASGPGVQTI